jgi:hypothetical protein
MNVHIYPYIYYRIMYNENMKNACVKISCSCCVTNQTNFNRFDFY